MLPRIIEVVVDLQAELSAVHLHVRIGFNYYGHDDDFFEYAYYCDDLPNILKPELFELYNEDDPEEGYDFDRWALVEMMKSGTSPFRDGKAPADALTPADIRALATA